jgi:tetratricopeptide (TPR) repeat protein
MNFEDDSLEAAYNALESTEKFCDVDTSIFSSSERREAISKLSPHEKLLRRAISADCLLLEAMIVFLRQSLTSYLKGGYIIRKAWKQYEEVVRDLEKLCDTPCPLDEYAVSQHVGTYLYDHTNGDVPSEQGKTIPEEPEVDGDMKNPSPLLARSKESPSQVKKASSTPPHPRGPSKSPKASPQPRAKLSNGKGTPPELVSQLKNAQMKDSVDSLSSLSSLSIRSPIQYLDHHDNRSRAAVYFGYGMMNVVLSLIPPKLLRLANLLGFHGDRERGLQALEFCSQSQDMKAPLAKLFLLWYHTIIRHFFALDGSKQDGGCEEATRILDDSLAQYPTSPIFLYFRGKVHYLRGNLKLALEAYDFAASNTKGQKEVEHICLYEKGWVEFLQLRWDKALPCFIRLKDETRWSACYYGYLTAIVTGMSGNLERCQELFVQCTKLVKRKNNNMEKFCSRRGSAYKKSVSERHVRTEVSLMAVEVMYLWRALPCCGRDVKEELLAMLDGLDVQADKVFHVSLRCMLKGALLVELERYQEAERVLREALRYETNVKQDKHIFSFSMYELAVIQIKQKQYMRARKLLHQAKEGFSGYEFEARLNFQVHSSLGFIQSVHPE